jgi:predicted nucleic acid-binding protein
MTQVFADAAYFIALLSPDDEFHDRALTVSSQHHGRVLTTEWVLAEVGNALCRGNNRRLFCETVRRLRTSTRVRIISASESAFQAGFELYEQRSDKDWSLIDCISMTIMDREGIRDVLTSDRHFEQAGYVALLRS